MMNWMDAAVLLSEHSLMILEHVLIVKTQKKDMCDQARLFHDN